MMALVALLGEEETLTVTCTLLSCGPSATVQCRRRSLQDAEHTSVLCSWTFQPQSHEAHRLLLCTLPSLGYVVPTTGNILKQGVSSRLCENYGWPCTHFHIPRTRDELLLKLINQLNDPMRPLALTFTV